MKFKKQLFTLVIVLSICIVSLKAFAITTKGDFDNNGRLSKEDALLIAKKVWSNDTASCDKEVADYDGDGEITIKDAQAIMKKVDTSFIVGDANLDGEMIQDDAELILKYTTGTYLSDEAKLAADYDGNGVILSSDARKVLQSIIENKGDINNDKNLTKEDALLLANKVWSHDTDSCDKEVADLNNDGKITIKDAQIIMKAVNSEFLIGDANLDGEITQDDAKLIMEYAVGIVQHLSDEAKLAADYNCDGILTSNDSRNILEIIAGRVGDMNKDKSLTKEDAFVLANKIWSKDIDSYDKKITDYNNDGEVAIKDAQDIMKEVNPNFLIGDVNLDGKMTQDDAEIILKYTVGKIDYLCDEAKLAADYNGDGLISSTDARYILETIPQKKGDMNKDGKINSIDASIIIDKFTSGKYTSEDLAIGDMNDDDKLNAIDASLILDAYTKENSIN